MSVIRWITEGRLKRADCSTRWDGDGYKDVVLSEDYDALAADAEKWKRKHQVEVGWACAKVEESADRINALEAGLRLVVSLTTPCECVPCTRIRTEALNVLAPNAGLTADKPTTTNRYQVGGAHDTAVAHTLTNSEYDALKTKALQYDALAAELATARKLALNQAKIGVDQETRIRDLEAALMALSNKCHGELGCPGYKLAYDLGLCPPAETPAEHPDKGTPNYCPICSPKNIGYCRCEVASNE